MEREKEGKKEEERREKRENRSDKENKIDENRENIRNFHRISVFYLDIFQKKFITKKVEEVYEDQFKKSHENHEIFLLKHEICKAKS